MTAQKVAEGVWYLTGGIYHSAVIEMMYYVIVVESPLNDDRALAAIAEAKRLVPNKPIRYIVNRYHHFDYSSGLRAIAAEGASGYRVVRYRGAAEGGVSVSAKWWVVGP